jgi:pimeloyl-ACP methyl ester carboxylesterase
MSAELSEHIDTATTESPDGTAIAYHALGQGPGLVIIGGVLWEGSDYLPLARALAGEYRVHVMERRARPGSGPQREGHGIEEECADAYAVATATGATSLFGHSFGGLVALETARRHDAFDEVVVYDPGIPLRGQYTTGWFEGYEHRLAQGDRRGALVWMSKYSRFSPWIARHLPLTLLRRAMARAIKGEAWDKMDRLLEANLVEHRLQAALDALDASRFAQVRARALLLGGTKSPGPLSGGLLPELARAIPDSRIEMLKGLGHFAPREKADRVASAILQVRGAGRM